MKLTIKILLILITSFLSINLINAQEEDIEIKNIEYNILENIEIKKNIHILEKLKIDLSFLEKEFISKYDDQILFEWNIPGEKTINWAILEKQFKTFWEKELNLNIYKITWENRELISNEKTIIFVYKTKILSFIERNQEEKINDFNSKAKESWIFINKVVLYKDEIEKYNFSEKIYSNLKKDNYVIIWWGKNFIFDILSKINTENINISINIVWITGFNINILQKFLHNLVSNKNWINKALLLDESSKYEVLKQPDNINTLEYDIIKNNFKHINLNNISKINEILFISKFVNNLSNAGFSLNNIYLILIIPFLLLMVSIFKHLIGLNLAWILIPVTMTLLFLKLGLIPTLILILIFFITNIILSKFITKYSLHYTPKVTMLTIINIIVFIITINLFLTYDLVRININDVMFIIFFILIAERLINIMASKEFWEYKITLINTILFSILWLIIFQLVFIKTFILAYPEVILLLIPLIFIIWRFTWLRITEYFRFKEVIKSIEE